jgi:hypothetical protein
MLLTFNFNCLRQVGKNELLAEDCLICNDSLLCLWVTSESFRNSLSMHHSFIKNKIKKDYNLDRLFSIKTKGFNML